MTYTTHKDHINITTPRIDLRLPTITANFLKLLSPELILELYTLVQNTARHDTDQTDNLYTLLYQESIRVANKQPFLRHTWTSATTTMTKDPSILKARELALQMDAATDRITTKVCPDCHTARENLNPKRCPFCGSTRTPEYRPDSSFKTDIGTFHLHRQDNEDYYTYTDNAGVHHDREATNDIVDTYSIQLPTKAATLTTPHNLQPDLRTMTDIDSIMLGETTDVEVTVFHPTFIKLTQDVNSLSADTSEKRKPQYDDETYNQLLRTTFSSPDNTTAQILTATHDHEQTHPPPRTTTQPRVPTPTYTTQKTTPQEVIDTLRPRTVPPPDPNQLRRMYDSPANSDLDAIMTIRHNPDSPYSLTQLPVLCTDMPPTEPDPATADTTPAQHIINIIRSHRGEVRLLDGTWTLHVGTMPQTKRTRSDDFQQQLRLLRGREPFEPPTQQTIDQHLYRPGRGNTYWQRSGHVYNISGFLYAFGSYFSLHQLHRLWLSLPTLLDKRHKTPSRHSREQTVQHAKLSQHFQRLLAATGIPPPANQRQRDMIQLHVKQLLVAQYHLERLGHIPLEPQQHAPDHNELMWTASFDERLQLNLATLRNQDIIPNDLLDLLYHPVHQDQPEQWIPASQHYACPRTVDKHNTRARCGAISRPVSGYLYTNHTTGKRNRHTCVSCDRQWQRSGLCYAVILTTYRHTLQIYMEPAPDKMRHDHEKWVANYLATYEPFLPYRDTPPYNSPPEHTTRLELTGSQATQLWAALYQPLTPRATYQLLTIQSSRLRHPPEEPTVSP